MTATLGFMMFDPMYFLYVGPFILLAMWASWRVKSTFAQMSQVGSRSNFSGAETAQHILDAYGIRDVGIEPVQSFLGDHYDPKSKMLRLSPDVYNGRSVAALGIAAHEVGHALQHADRYAPLALRNGLVPLASIGSQISVWLVIIGIFLSMTPLAIVGLALFGTTVIFQLVNLPVEFNASSRARRILLEQNIITQEEDPAVGKVLNAAALTYVAATLIAIFSMLYYASLVFGHRREE